MGIAKSCLTLHMKPEYVSRLDFSRHQLNEVPSHIFDYECTLEYLDLSSNSIADLPRHLFLCTGLKSLNISDNQLLAIPEAVAALKELLELNAAKNDIQTVPTTISVCSKLTHLNLSATYIQSIPDNTITNLIHLVDLCLNDAYLEFLPANIGKLVQLRNLELRCNRMESLPLTLVKLRLLENFDIGANEFEEFPDVIGHLESLVSLHIDENGIKRIPDVIGRLTQLEFLNADDNSLVELSAEIGLCTNLRELHIENNQLTRVPDNLSQCVRLERLKVSHNCLLELPASLQGLHSVFEIRADHNYLQSLPHTIGMLRRLNHLCVDFNFLTALPDEICSCASLRVLSVCENFLCQLPANIGQLKQLQILNVIGNNVVWLPLSLNNIRVTLKALWLSDQQIKPLPSLSMAETDTVLPCNVLTCFMLPQSKIQATEIERATDEEARLPYLSESLTRKKMLRFEKTFEEGVVPSPLAEPKKHKLAKGKHSLNRSPTPHPSELKKMAHTAQHIVTGGMTQLKKTGGKTYRCYGKVDDVAAVRSPPTSSTGSVVEPISFEIREAIVTKKEKFQPNVSYTAQQMDESAVEHLYDCYQTAAEIYGDTALYQTNSPGHIYGELTASHHTAMSITKSSPLADELFVSNRSSLRHSPTSLSHSQTLPINSVDVANIPPSTIQCNPITDASSTAVRKSLRREPPPYQEACKYSKLSDADFVIYDSIRNLQKSRHQLHAESKTTAAVESMQQDQVNNNVSGQSTATGESIDANGNFLPPTPPPMTNHHIPVTEPLTIDVTTPAIDEFPPPPSPLDSMVELSELDHCMEQPLPNGDEDNLHRRPQLSPTSSDYSFASNYSSTNTTPKRKWAFGNHRNVSVKELTITKQCDRVPFKIFQKTRQGIFVRSVDTKQERQLHVNDKILECNGIDFLKISVETAEGVLEQIEAGATFKLMISR